MHTHMQLAACPQNTIVTRTHAHLPCNDDDQQQQRISCYAVSSSFPFLPFQFAILYIHVHTHAITYSEQLFTRSFIFGRCFEKKKSCIKSFNAQNRHSFAKNEIIIKQNESKKQRQKKK